MKSLVKKIVLFLLALPIVTNAAFVQDTPGAGSSTFACVYSTNKNFVMLAFSDGNIVLKEHDRMSSTPTVHDKEWRNSNLVSDFTMTTTYKNGALIDCPQYIMEIVDANDSNTVLEYFFMDSPKEGDATHKMLYKEKLGVGYVDFENKYWKQFSKQGSCKKIEAQTWKKTCTYRTNKDVLYLYINDNDFFIASEKGTNTIKTEFTKSELGNSCPQKFNYKSSGSTITLSLDNPNWMIAQMDKNYTYTAVPALCDSNNIDVIPQRAECITLFGNPRTPGKPAYYIQAAFDVMKYVGIVLLVVMSIIDYVSAVTASDSEALKKANTKLITRIIICIVLLVLPTLLKVIFQIAGIYDAANCGIK